MTAISCGAFAACLKRMNGGGMGRKPQVDGKLAAELYTGLYALIGRNLSLEVEGQLDAFEKDFDAVVEKFTVLLQGDTRVLQALGHMRKSEFQQAIVIIREALDARGLPPYRES